MSEGRVPIMRVGRILIASIQSDLDDLVAVSFQDDLANAIVRHSARPSMSGIWKSDSTRSNPRDAAFASRIVTIASRALDTCSTS